MLERRIVISPGPLQPGCWAISKDAEGEGRYVKQTCCPGYFAVVRLRLELYLGPEAILFVNTLTDESRVWCVAVEGPPEANRLVGSWAPFTRDVVEGIREGLSSASPDGRPLQALKLSLVEMRVHPIDSRPAHLRKAAAMAVTDGLQQAGLEPGPA